MYKAKSGFTIVELLIVIVVVGILAAISLVAYSGIQSQANDATRKSDMAQLKKKLETWSLQNDGATISVGSPLAYLKTTGTVPLTKNLTGTPDWTLYAVFDITDASHAWTSIVRLDPDSSTGRFQLDEAGSGDTAMRYRIDTSVQPNIYSVQPAVRTAGRHVGWGQMSGNGSLGSVAYDQSAVYDSDSLTTPYAGWGFTTLRLSSTTSTIGIAALVFDTAHDETTRREVLRWLDSEYNITASF